MRPVPPELHGSVFTSRQALDAGASRTALTLDVQVRGALLALPADAW